MEQKNEIFKQTKFTIPTPVTYHVGDKLFETLFKGTREFSAKSYTSI
jgi:hypothetical protein